MFLLTIVTATWADDVNLNQHSNGTNIQIAKGQFLSITLPSNPTTGYNWQFAGEPDAAVLVQQVQEFIPSSTNRIGAGGEEYLRYEAVGAGTTRIRLVYVRPWEKNALPAKVFSVQVSVYSGAAALNTVVFRVGLPYYVVNGRIIGSNRGISSFISQNRVLAPVRILANDFGLTGDNITWDQSTQRVTLCSSGTTVQMTIGQAFLTVNGETKTIDAVPILIQGTTFAPVRYVAGALGYQVAWDAEDQVVVCWPKGQTEPDISETVAWLNQRY